jgi:uncharacterized membrane protein
MHCRIIDDVLERYQGKLWRFRLTVFCALSGSIGAVAGAAMVMSNFVPLLIVIALIPNTCAALSCR